MTPLVCIRLGHPKELSWHFLERMLFQVGQHEEQFVRHHRYGTVVIRTVTTACAGLPINGVLPHIGLKGVLEMRE